MSGRTAAGPAARLLHLGRALGAALIVLAAPAAAAAAPTASAQASQFPAPEAPLILTREIRRALADGRQLVVRRRYLVRFHAHAGGFTVNGDPAGVEVEAPAVLADLAAIERQRPDTGQFPLELDRAGLIVARPPPAETVDAARARTARAAYLARSDLTAPERAAAEAMALKLQSRGEAAGNTWPIDLFRPAPGQRREQRELPLPGGRSGRVSVTIQASSGSGGLLSRMERQVTTELDGTQRVTLERWTLTEVP